MLSAAINVGINSNGVLTINNGATVTTAGSITGAVWIAADGGNSTVTLGNGGTGTALLTTTATSFPNALLVGGGGNGTLNVNAGGSVTGFGGMVLGQSSGSTSSVTVNGGAVNVSHGNQFTYVGGPGAGLVNGGVGTLLIENGGTVTSAGVIIAATATGNGSSATVTGAGSIWTVNSGMIVGYNGNGSLTVQNGGAVNFNTTAVPTQIYLTFNGGAGSGTLTVNGGTFNANNSQLFIGTSGTGTGTMTIENGGVVTQSDLAEIGPSLFGTTSTGSVTVTGANSLWSLGPLDLENNSDATSLTVSNGASLVSGLTTLGQFVINAANNALVVTGPGSTWQSGSIVIGNGFNRAGGGTGTISVLDGAHAAASGNVEIGYSTDGGGGRTDKITVDGAGSQFTTATNLYVGYFGTGNLVVSNGAAVSDVVGDIAYSSTNATGSATQFGGAITTPSNSVGAAIVTGPGSIWQNGTLIVGDNTTAPGAGFGVGTATASLTVADGGEVTSTNPITVAANAGATGTINIGSAAGQAAVAPGSLVAPAIVFGAGTGKIVFNHTSTNYIFGIPIEGAGSVDAENGATVLTAINTYTGATTINGGVLDVAGAIIGTSGVTVNSGGALTGAGAITTPTVTINSGGTFAPGAPGVFGTSMTINGNLAFQSGALYLVQVNAATATFANVSGTAALAGDVLPVVALKGLLQHQYMILESAGLNGTKFSGLITTGLPPGVHATLSYNADDVFLNVTAGIGADTVLPANQQNVANVLNNVFNNGGTLPPGFNSLFGLSGANLVNALSQLDGEAATDSTKGAFLLMSDFLGLMLDPFVNGHAGGVGGSTTPGFAPEQQASFSPDIALAYASVLKAPPQPTFTQRWSAWGSAFGGYNKNDGNPTVGSNDVTAHDFGFAAGMDYRLSLDSTVGFALAGGGTNWGLAQGLGGGRSDSFEAGIYGKTHSGPAYLSAALAFANHWFTTDRTALGDQLTAKFDGQSYGGRVEAGYRFALPAGAGGLGRGIGVIPYAALQAQSFHTPSYSETDLTGGGLGLTYNAMSATDTRSELGTRFDDLAMLGAMPLILRARIAWAHDWVSNPTLGAIFQALPGGAFTVNGAPPPVNSAIAGASAELHIAANWSLLGKFDGEFARGAQTYAGTGTLRYTW